MEAMREVQKHMSRKIKKTWFEKITFYIFAVQIMGGSKFSQISCFIVVNSTTLAIPV